LFNPKQLRFLLKFCEFEVPALSLVTQQTFDEIWSLHQTFMSTVAEQFVFHDEWDISATGPLKRREHDMHI